MLTTLEQKIALKPFYLDGEYGQIFCLFSDVPDDDIKEVWLCLAPFAEEMNRCRVMVAMQARKLATHNVATLIPDYYGTGDSGGDFSDATWDAWKSDIHTAIHWLEAKGIKRIRLWGIRMGALLAAEIASESAGKFDQLVFWQPVVDGKMMLTQFLRVRVAAAMDRGEAKETTKAMRDRFSSGKSVEIAGYNLSGALAQAIDSKHLGQLSLPAHTQVEWYEQYNEATNSISMPSQKVISQWSEEHKVSVNENTFVGAPFWQVHERELALDLIDKTAQLVQRAK